MPKSVLLRLPSSLLARLARIPFRATTGSALLEVLCLQTVIALLLPLFLPTIVYRTFLHLNLSDRSLIVSDGSPGVVSDITIISFILFCMIYGGCTVLWTMLRWCLRPPERSRLKQMALECVMTILLFCELLFSINLLMWGLGTIVPYTFLHPFINVQTPREIFGLPSSQGYLLFSVVISVTSACCFFFARFFTHLLSFWNRLRRRQLRWALTHAHLMILIWGALVSYFLAIAIAITTFNVRGVYTPFEIFVAYMILIGFVILFLAIIGIVFILPPSALFSYLFSRRLVRRIEDLANATSSLSSGQYNVRVTVDGEDEVARLQHNFNAMAGDLERTLSELQEERDTVSTLLQARRELIASVSHELRTPVATVRSYLEATLTGWRSGPPLTLHQDLQVMEQQIIRLQSMINDLFTLARAEVGRLEMRTLPVNVELLVRRVVDTMAPVVWRGSRVEVVADITPAFLSFPRVLADEHRLEQILQNLLHNAVRHTPPGGIIVVSASADEQLVILQIKDTGEGIAPADLERIWDRFYRAQSACNQSGNGSGLGLTIVKDLTEAMGGTVAVVSTPGQGSIFTICLPRVGTGMLSTQPTQPMNTLILSTSLTNSHFPNSIQMPSLSPLKSQKTKDE